MSNNDTITINESDILASIDDNDTITLSNWDSPLSTSLSTDYTYSATLGTPTSMASGGSGATLTTTTGGSLMWNNPNHTVTASPYTVSNTTTGWATYTQPAMQGKLTVSGDATFDGEVTIRGVKLDDRLTAIEERLGILRPNNDLEGKWEKLKALGEEYRKLEQEILEGENIWDILKK
jgi:hypothetical protein